MLNKDCHLCEFTGNIHPTDTRLVVRTRLHFVRGKYNTDITSSYSCMQCRHGLVGLRDHDTRVDDKFDKNLRMYKTRPNGLESSK